MKVAFSTGLVPAVPHLERAVAIAPKFAMAYRNRPERWCLFRSERAGDENNGRRFLNADDHPAVRTVMRLLFDKNGFEVCGEPVNGLDAIEKAQRIHPDLIVLDFCMPVMDGIEASRQLTRLMPGIPLLMFTSHVSKVMEEDAREAGIRRIIAKGESFQRLIDDARELLI
jgi:CheY-like chemotaxis protein